jgi:hypothetical protein
LELGLDCPFSPAPASQSYASLGKMWLNLVASAEDLAVAT